MATTQYFPHYSNARNDEKILALRMKYGMEGYGVFFAILERLLDSTDYMLSTNYNLIAFDFRVSNEFIKSIVEDFGLFEFTEDHEYFYSVRFLEHMYYKDDVSQKRAEAGRKGGLSKAKKQESSNCLANAKQTSSIKRNKTKQNETRRNETKPRGGFFFRVRVAGLSQQKRQECRNEEGQGGDSGPRRRGYYACSGELQARCDESTRQWVYVSCVYERVDVF